MPPKGHEYKICIDRDEEIMDVVDRLRRIPARSVTLVVPQHAMLLHSGVNLKILAFESRRMDKHITIMTNDEEGIALARRAQIATVHYRGDDSGDLPQSSHGVSDVPLARPVMSPPRPAVVVPPSAPNRLSVAARLSSRRPTGVVPRPVMPLDHRDTVRAKRATTPPRRQSPRAAGFAPRASGPRRATAAHGAQTARRVPVTNASSAEKHLASRKPRIVTWVLAVGALGVLCFVATLAILPFSSVTVYLKHTVKDEQVEVTARAQQEGVDGERRMIPARIVERDVTLTKTFPATGSGNVGAQKARGKITITNTDTTSQPLVATTRFLAQDGTLFRLVNAVTVPAATGEAPGSVEALVVADKAGAEGNIGPTTFTVPGLSTSAKQGKITAASTAAMTGGGEGGDGVAVVTADDLVAAKAVTEDETPEYVRARIMEVLRPDEEVLVDGALSVTRVQSEADATANAAQKEFHYTTVTRTRAIVFSRKDIRAVADTVFAETLASYDATEPRVTVTYGEGSADFDTQSMKVDARIAVDATARIDRDAFAKDIAGKKHDALHRIITENYAKSVDKITIAHVIPRWPAVLADRISPLGIMTDVDFVE